MQANGLDADGKVVDMSNATSSLSTGQTAKLLLTFTDDAGERSQITKIVCY